MARLGQPLYGCPTPDGYKNTRDAWLNPDALTLRLSFATALGSGHLPLDVAPPAMEEEAIPQPAQALRPAPVDSDRLLALLRPTLSARTLDALGNAAPQLTAALILGSPDFMAR